MENKLVIRADATTRMGAGHIMRSIALAQRWKSMPGSVTFLSYCESGELKKRIVSEGFEYIEINSPEPGDRELAGITDFLKNGKSHEKEVWVGLDGHLFSTDYHLTIREAGLRLLVIDDYNHLSFYNADIIVNQNLKDSAYRYNCNSDAVKLLGTKYALIRNEFLKFRGYKRKFPDKARKILVTMGGSDSDNNTLKALRAIKMLKDPDMDIRVVVGASNPHMKSLRSLVLSNDFDFQLLPSVNNMAPLMAWADLAVTAGGSTCWELCFMGVPSVVVCVAENQNEIAKNMGKMNRNRVFDTNSLSDSKAVAEVLKEMIFDKDLRIDASSIMRDEIDGYGSQRIIDFMKMKSSESLAS
ncbi:UDP-2,4-diacetamido-2,4,6-trideoxy-beta-L-altropyranose hydrolase [Thermodesulfobacteriota bacterium]